MLVTFSKYVAQLLGGIRMEDIEHTLENLDWDISGPKYTILETLQQIPGTSNNQDLKCWLFSLQDKITNILYLHYSVSNQTSVLKSKTLCYIFTTLLSVSRTNIGLDFTILFISIVFTLFPAHHFAVKMYALNQKMMPIPRERSQGTIREVKGRPVDRHNIFFICDNVYGKM